MLGFGPVASYPVAGPDALAEAYRTTAVVYYAVRVVSGLWATTGVNPSADLQSLRSWLPPARQPIAYEDRGRYYMDAAWYRFFHHVAEVRLGGLLGATIPDVVATVEDTQASGAEQSAIVASLKNQTSTNAEALSAQVQVSIANSLTGADQIPPVQIQADQAIP